jgi:hypothetical protein
MAGRAKLRKCDRLKFPSMPRRPEPTPPLFVEVSPKREGNRLFCHQEFLEKMEEHRGKTVGRRAALLLQRLLVDLSRPHYKPTQGDRPAPRGAEPALGAPLLGIRRRCFPSARTGRTRWCRQYC